MKMENKDIKEQAIKMLNEAEDKSDAIVQVVEMLSESHHEQLIEEIIAQSERAAVDAEYKKSLGLQRLSEDEKKFYEQFKDIKQAITASQIDIIPTSIVDRTLADVREASPILSLVEFAPADVKKWLTGSHSGVAKWGDALNVKEITSELSATITGMNVDEFLLTAYLVIPKAISELGLEYVDKYFTAILAEAMQDGLVAGFLNGDGVTGPIGIMRMVSQKETDGKAKAKTALTNVTKFSPKGLSGVRKTLSNGGKRVVETIYLLCNPSDEAEYVDPALYGEALTGGYHNVSFVNLEKIVDANVPSGKGIFTIAGHYTMGTTGVRLNKYEQTLAMKNADLVIASAYANGRADDDNTAVVFDVTKLVEYVLPVTQVTAPAAGNNTEVANGGANQRD